MKLVITFMLAVAAASAVTLPDKDSLLIRSTPTGATVVWNRQEICTTPCLYKLGDYAFNVRKSTLFSKRLVQPVVLHIALDGYQAKDLVITQPWTWRSFNGQNAFTYYTVVGQIFDFALDKISAHPTLLSNADVVELWNGGFGEDLIIDKINSGATGFSLETADMLALKQAGVADVIIQAMLHKSTPLTQ
jgi:hypothetical protein